MVYYDRETPKEDKIIRGRWNCARLDNCQWPGVFMTTCVRIIGPAPDSDKESVKVELMNLRFVMGDGRVVDLWPLSIGVMQRNSNLNYAHRRKMKEEKIEDILNNCEPISKNALGMELASFLSAFVRELDFVMTDRVIIDGIMTNDNGLNGNACRTILRIYGRNSLTELTKRAALDFFDNSDRMRFESDAKEKLKMMAKQAKREATLKIGSKTSRPIITCHN